MTFVSRRMPMRARGLREQGQALLWFLGTVAASSAIMFAVFNAGQVTAAKQKVVNAADAGALAGAMTEARILNTMAYGNRAIVANEVLIVQLVSLDSWTRYMTTAANGIKTYSKLIPYVGNAISAIFQAVEQITKSADNMLTKAIIPGAVAAEEVFKGMGAALHFAFRQSGFLLAQSVASQVVEQNKTTFGNRSDTAPTIPWAETLVFATANQNQWSDLTRQYSGNDRTRSRDVILASRDAFSTENGRQGNALMNLKVPYVFELDKTGGTRLQGFDRWEAQDAWDLSAVWDYKKWKWRKKVPLGWGRATLAKDTTNGTKWGSSKAQKRAYQNTNKFSGWTGIPALYDVRDRTDQDPRVQFMLYVVKAESATFTTKKLGMAKDVAMPVGSPNADEKTAKDRVASLSKAEVYFARPQRGVGDWTADGWGGGATLFRADGAKEYGSLYSPFWQARLAAVTDAEKIVAAAAAGVVLPPGVLQ